jgi:tRNA A-37 threonylcarbamoyl transferase component Bud32
LAELIVRIPYKNEPRAAALYLLQCTFPIWAVLLPVAAVAILIAAVGILHNSGMSAFADANLLYMFGLATSFIVTSVIGLVATNWLAHSALVIDKKGIELPFSLVHPQQTITWENTTLAHLSSNDDRNWKQNEIVIRTSNSARLKISLQYLQPDQVEQLIMAMEIWGHGLEVDPGVKHLGTTLGGTAVGALSFTDMWDDELSRRFSSTAFVPLEPGHKVRKGTLSVVRHLALGGLSAVYLCQLDNQKLVVLKEAVVSDDATEAAQAKAREMLDREARTLLKLEHPAIVHVLDHFIEDKRDYLMLEYISGQDLRQFVRQHGPQSEPNVLDWALQMVTILKCLHEHEPPIIHRDFTPDNLVLREDGSVVLIDFGTANEFIGTATGTFVGKHAFIAPEQFRGKSVVQSDIYALGCTLFYLLTAQEPEALSTSNPKQCNDNISKELAELIECCTQIEARDRFQSAAQMIPILRQMSSSTSMLH